MLSVKNEISSLLKSAVSGAFPFQELTQEELCGMLEYPPDREMGDLAFPCFKLSKTLRSSPMVICSKIVENLEKTPSELIEKINPVGGYLNFKLSASALAQRLLPEMLDDTKAYGSSNIGEGKTVVLDYSSPNICKPFHIGHLGSTIIGHSIRKIHEFCGYRCIGINHLGDWGTQFGKLIVAYRKWGDKETVEKGGVDELVKLYVRFHEEAEKDPSLNDLARNEFHKLETGDPENLALWKWFVEISVREFKTYYEKLGVEFDSYAGESFYTDKMAEQVELLREKGLLKIDQGASVVDLEAYGMPPCLILKTDGSTLYPTRDIAAAAYRAKTYHFDKCVYITSSQQCLHFKQWFQVVSLMGYDWASKLVHVPYGTVSINGEKLATRSGNVILIKDLIKASVDKVRAIMEEKNPDLPDMDRVAEEVGVGAIVFNYLFNSRIKDINFVLEDALSFDGNTG
ncbi:MAG: arginine--tRNA ligase, partial [Clostridia bacterium]|nr:arginine--tRNA ligase [Clostridia bacterium]